MKNFSVVIFLLIGLFACKKDPPPPMTICLLGPYGGAQCVDPEGMRDYRYPSTLKNYMALSPDDTKALFGWCYGTNGPLETHFINRKIDEMTKTLGDE